MPQVMQPEYGDDRHGNVEHMINNALQEAVDEQFRAIVEQARVIETTGNLTLTAYHAGQYMELGGPAARQFFGQPEL
ncbi:MAG: hypothetical protein JWM37_174 [Candidatus Saccharibacteria bacterium]|nr:hypothetical protein [Candidatus Saccharibacteria bacterium]